MPSKSPRRVSAAKRGKRGQRTRFLKIFTSDAVFLALSELADRDDLSISRVGHNLLAEAVGQAPYKRVAG